MPSKHLSEAQIREIQELAREGNAIDPAIGEVQVLDVPPPPTTKWGKIYRAAAFQMVIVAALAFAGPGMSEAITALGGGGLAAPWAVNAATAVSYTMVGRKSKLPGKRVKLVQSGGLLIRQVATVSAMGGPIASRLGIRWMLIIGAATFPINGSAYYVSQASFIRRRNESGNLTLPGELKVWYRLVPRSRTSNLRYRFW